MDIIFFNRISEYLEEKSMYIQEISRESMLDKFKRDSVLCKDFPMIAYEKTSDSDVTVTPDVSKFLNDDDYDNWFVIKDENSDDVAYMCIDTSMRGVIMDAFELSVSRRGSGIGRYIVEMIEDCADDCGYDIITLSPFDTDAMNFWNHMGYKKDNTFYSFYKYL